MARWRAAGWCRRGFVAAARLHADVAVLDEVEAADAVLAADLVQQWRQQLVGLHRVAVDGDEVALSNSRSRYSAASGAFSGDTGPAPHRFFGLGGRVFQVAAFVAEDAAGWRPSSTASRPLVLHVDRMPCFSA